MSVTLDQLKRDPSKVFLEAQESISPVVSEGKIIGYIFTSKKRSDSLKGFLGAYSGEVDKEDENYEKIRQKKIEDYEKNFKL